MTPRSTSRHDSPILRAQKGYVATLVRELAAQEPRQQAKAQLPKATKKVGRR